ncbi:MAG: hypothetical protein K2P99_03825 [Burkholderiales bacterium]|nr:hypothetical protein [Burkholderiales bacterium]
MEVSLSGVPIIFLDFDGVLHPKTRENFECLPNFISILKDFVTIKVVISSDWRDGISNDYLQSIFGVYSERIIGKTPNLFEKTREKEILKFVGNHKINKFIAIDDDCRGELFTKDCNWLFKTNYFKGLDEQSSIELRKFLVDRLYI